MYGGHRPGNNVFANTLVCVKCATGERVWHFQTVHHDLWDYDNNVAPILIDINVDGRPIKAVVQLTKQAMAYVFDRATGKPVWPIEERPVPQSNDARREDRRRRSRSRRKPAPFDRARLTVDDLIDFTPELRAEAIEISKHYVMGPIFTPPSIKGDGPGATVGTLQMPGATGGADWGGAGFDPGDRHHVHAVDHRRARRGPRSPATRRRPTCATRAATAPLHRPARRGCRSPSRPYGRITAINMNTGDQLWTVPNGDGSARPPGAEGPQPAAARPAEPRHAARSPRRCCSSPRAIRS